MEEALAAVERAEREPVLAHRVAAVRALIDEAAPLLEAAPALRARLLLRLASVKLAETDYEGADQALEAVGKHVPDDVPLRFLTGIRACRVGIRRGPAQRAEAERTLLAAATKLPELDDGNPTWRAATTEIALAIAELAVHDAEPAPTAFEPLAELLGEIGDLDAKFVGHQLLATYALGNGDLPRAIKSLRAVLQIARDAASPADEVEARIALASALAATDEPISAEEAAKHVQVARDRALEHELPELHHAALIAQAGILSHAGKTAGALERVLELARAAAEKHDVHQYVAAVGIMAELYARTGDHVSAFRTIAESHRALADATGSDTAHLFRPLLARLRDRIGADRLDAIARDVDHANRLADQIRPSKPSDPA
jgi:tetratricopeptide (TPR) repeat protein